MEKTPEKEYSRKVRQAAAALVVVLTVVSLIPPQSFGGVELRRANILSDLVVYDDTPAEAPSAVLFDEEEFRIDLAEVVERIEAETAPPRVQTLYEWCAAPDNTPRRPIRPDTTLPKRIVPIEEFDTARRDGMQAFYDTLLTARRPVQIGRAHV